MNRASKTLLIIAPLIAIPLTSAQNFVPADPASIGLTRLVPDTIVLKQEFGSLGNWEPYTSVLGNSVFLITVNTFATGSTDHQRYGLAFQPVGGGSNGIGDVFFADNGTPFRGPINASRQNGNPARVAGDKRPGAVNFIAGADASPHALAEFQSDNRFKIPNLYTTFADARYGTVQTYGLNPNTLAQTAKSKAIDVADGRLASGTPSGNEVTRFGGDLAGLDNGNFVAVVEDRSNLRNPSGRAVVATIVGPDGSIVKDSFVVTNEQIWSNVAAYKGGFAVRVGPQGLIYFYSNDGTLQGTVNQTVIAGITLDPALDRGDENRIGAHINSPYVYLASRATDGAGTKAVRLAVFDSRDRSFVTVPNVSELTTAKGGSDPNDFVVTFGRVTVAVDARDRVCVAYGSTPAGYGAEQGTARVLAFNGASKTFKYLTKSFFAFVNNAPSGGLRATTLNVSMTTRQICIAAKGEINSTNNPTAGVDTPKEVDFYTVIGHPDPQDDPTTPVGGGGPSLKILRSGNNLVISWAADFSGFTLESKNSLFDLAWATVGTQNPATIATGAGSKFYRLRK